VTRVVAQLNLPARSPKVLCPPNANPKVLCPPIATISQHLAALLFGRTACHVMRSVETREHLVRVARKQARSVASAARDLNISVRSATRCLPYFRDTGGEFHYDPAQWNRHSYDLRDDPGMREAVLSAVEKQPELFLDELTDAVNVVAAQVDGEVEVSPTHAARVLSHNGYIQKVIERAFRTQNEAHRVAWVAAQWQIPLRCRVYIDGAHRVGRSAQRKWAWSLRGERAECNVASSAGVRTSVFVAMAFDRLPDWFRTRPHPGQTAVEVILFVKIFVLPHMHAVEAGRAWDEQPNRCVLVLDNALIHDEGALAAVRAAGVVALLLPPYFPDHNGAGTQTPPFPPPPSSPSPARPCLRRRRTAAHSADGVGGGGGVEVVARGGKRAAAPQWRWVRGAAASGAAAIPRPAATAGVLKPPAAAAAAAAAARSHQAPPPCPHTNAALAAAAVVAAARPRMSPPPPHRCAQRRWRRGRRQRRGGGRRRKKRRRATVALGVRRGGERRGGDPAARRHRGGRKPPAAAAAAAAAARGLEMPPPRLHTNAALSAAAIVAAVVAAARPRMSSRGHREASIGRPDVGVGRSAGVAAVLDAGSIGNRAIQRVGFYRMGDDVRAAQQVPRTMQTRRCSDAPAGAQ